MSDQTRAAMYAFSVAVLALVAYRIGMSDTELALWENVLLHGIPASGLVLAAVKTWLARDRGDADADG